MNELSPTTVSQAGRRVAGRVAVVCESTACLPPDLARRYGITVIPIPFVFDGQTFLDGLDPHAVDFYSRLSAVRLPPKTSPPSPGAYIEAWRKASAGTGGVVSITVSSRISTLQRSASVAEQMAAEALPRTAVKLIDSGSAGMGQGFVALAAARAALDGAPMEEVLRQAERVRDATTMLVTLDRLDYLARASHLPLVSALGSIIPIKPVIQLSGGSLHLVARPRTRERAVAALLDRMVRQAASGPLHVAVQHAGAADEAGGLEEAIRQRFDCTELYISEFTPVMGGYAGPGLLGVVFYAEPQPQA
jgi:DegV family protein with EDD domain